MAPTKHTPTDLEANNGPFHFLPLTTLPPPAYPGTYARDPTYTVVSNFNTYTPSPPTKPKSKSSLPSIRKLIYVTVLILIVLGVAAGAVKHALDRKNGESGVSKRAVVATGEEGGEGDIEIHFLPHVVAPAGNEMAARPF